jgi:hypothetical protein
MKTKKSQTIALAFMLAIVVLLLALAFAKPLNQMTTNAMNETSEIGGMNCTNTLDNFVKAGCITADLGQAYIIGGLIALAGLLIGAKVMLG